jgi:hypothetical protein
MIENRMERRGIHVLLLLASAVALYPLVSIVMLALNEPGTRVSGFTIPKSISFENFATAWTRGVFGPALISSAIVATTVVVVSVVFSILSGYAFAAMRFPFKNALFIILLAGLMLPYEALIIPLFFGFRDLGLVDTRWALILPQIGFSVSFGTFWMRAAFEGQLGSLVEAARIDGAVFVDLAEGLKGRAELYIDAVHLSPEGYGVVAREISKQIQPDRNSLDFMERIPSPGARRRPHPLYKQQHPLPKRSGLHSSRNAARFRLPTRTSAFS